MLASEFINTMVFGMLNGLEPRTYISKMKKMKKKYDTTFFLLPNIVCKDGFSISVQVNNTNYCASENGVRTFGLDWKLVEWGFPSEPIDGEKYHAEDKDNTTDSVGGVSVKLIDELCDEHGGIDLQATLQGGVD